MPPIVSKLKVEQNVFSSTLHAQTDSLPSCFPCPFHLPFPSFSDVAEAQSYSASTVTQVLLRNGKETRSVT
jgi:hypothetical protein